MHHRKLTYDSEGTSCHGHLVNDKNVIGKRPGVLVAHAWMGQDKFARNQAEMLAKLGYVGFAVDIYGNGATASNADQAKELMMPFFLDRALLQKRIQSALTTLKNCPEVDTSKTGAIGFCFGGLTVLELLRSGADTKGIVSFHGVLTNAMGGQKAKTVPIAKSIHGAALILHGYDDPMMTPEDLAHYQKELNDAHVDWQLNIYGQTTHAFTNPEADMPDQGLKYKSISSERAFQSMRQFFKEIFS